VTAAVVSGLVLVAAMGAGLYQSLTVDGGLPSIDLAYVPAIRASLDAGHPEDAIEQLRLAVEIDAANPGVSRLLEQVALEQGDLESRVFALRAYLRAQPFDAAARVRLSRAFLEQAQQSPARRAQRLLARAVWQAEQAIAEEPDSADAHLALGQALEAAGETERAREALENARRLAPLRSASSDGDAASAVGSP